MFTCETLAYSSHAIFVPYNRQKTWTFSKSLFPKERLVNEICSFDAANYWSSTEVSSTNACKQNFNNGNINSNNKTNSNRVRAFRSENL